MFGTNKKIQALEAAILSNNSAIQSLNILLETRLRKLEGDKTKETSSNDSLAEDLSKARLEIIELKKQLTTLKGKKAVAGLKAVHLKQLKESFEGIPSGAQGLQGTVIFWEKKTKQIRIETFKSKPEALALIARAEKGEIRIVI